MEKTLPNLTVLWLFAILLLSSCATPPPPASLQIPGVTMNLQRPVRSISDMAISQDGSLLITVENPSSTGSPAGSPAEGRQTIRLWDLALGRQLRTMAVDTLSHIHSIALSPDGQNLLLGGRSAGGGQSSLGIWNLSSIAGIKHFPELKQEVACVAFSPDGRSLLATHGTMVSLFNTETGEFTGQFDAGYTPFLLPLPMRLLAAFTPDGQYILTGGTDAILRMWDIESGKKVQALVGHERSHQGGITGISISSDGQFAFTSSAGDATARRWEIATGQLQQKFTGRKGFLSGIGGTAISPDDTTGFLATTPPAIWDLASGIPAIPLHWSQSVTARSSSEVPAKAFFHPNGKILVAHLGDSTIRLFDTATGRELAMLVGFDDDEWLVLTAEGYYNASPRGADHLTTGVVGQMFTLERFYDTFYRPDIVMTTLQGQDPRNIAPLTMAEAIKSPPPTLRFTTPVSDTDQETINICYQASDGGGGIGEVRLFHNGKLVVSDGYYRDLVRVPTEKFHLMAMNGPAIHEQMRSIAQNDGGQPMSLSTHEKGSHFSDCKEITAVPGNNELEITAFNKANSIQSTRQALRFRSSKTAEPAHLYIVSIGTNKFKEKAINLKYATKNATDIQQRLRRQGASIYSPENIHHELLLNDTADKATILKKINELAERIKPADGFVLFVSGHGVLLQHQYYLLTSNYDGTLGDTNAISSNELIDIAKKIKSLNQLFIFDTCHAGGIDSIVDSLYEARMSLLARKMGVTLFTANSSVQEALDGYQGNGLFTHALLDGLNNNKQADQNNDQGISLGELGRYARQSATTLAEKLGFQQPPLIFQYGGDSLVYRFQ